MPLFAALTLLCVTALALGVGDLQLKPGEPLSLDTLDGSSRSGLTSQIGLPSTILSWVAGAVRVVLIVLLPFAVLHFLRSRSARRRVLLQLFYLLLFSAALLSLARSFGTQQVRQPSFSPPQSALPGRPAEVVPALPEAPQWLLTAASGLAAAMLAWLGYRLYQASRAEPASAPRLAERAQQALADIEAGDRLENVILRAYYQLCVASRRRRGLSRAQHQTAREYGDNLQASGLPQSAIDKLTALFERARYGGRTLNQEDERQAIAALRAVLRSLEEL